MQVDIWIHPWDIPLESVDEVLNNIVGFMNVSNITIFANHVDGIGVNGIFLFENRVYTTRFSPGQLFFKPDNTLYRATKLKPYFVEGATFFDLKYVTMKANSYGLKTVVHVNFMNNFVLDEEFLSIDNEGEPVKYGGSWLSIHNSNVQRYMIALANNIALLDFVDVMELGEYWYPLSPALRGRAACFSRFAQTDARDEELNLSEYIPVIRKIANKLKLSDATFIKYSMSFTPSHYAILKKFNNMLEKELPEFTAFRCDTVYDVISSLIDVVKSCGIKVILLVPPPSISSLLGVDYKMLSREVDGIRPVLYYGVFHNNTRALINELKKAKKLSRSTVIPILSITAGMDYKVIVKLMKQIAKLGFEEISIYSYGFLTREKIKMLGDLLK
ncbi:MAG: hypothetical protein DRJ66_02755 [Thermoprotei archaeon]|nr:MAG: hypothetical protein DRJ66_02755 [Thermoprotei archaeon]